MQPSIVSTTHMHCTPGKLPSRFQVCGWPNTPLRVQAAELSSTSHASHASHHARYQKQTSSHASRGPAPPHSTRRATRGGWTDETLGSWGCVARRGLEETPRSGQEMQKILKITSSSCHHGPTRNTRKWRPLRSQWKTTRTQPQPALQKRHQSKHRNILSRRDTISLPVLLTADPNDPIQRCGINSERDAPVKSKETNPGFFWPTVKVSQQIRVRNNA